MTHTQEERMQHRLAVQSMQIERFLSQREVSSSVRGGTWRGRWVDFDLQSRLSDGVDRVRDWAQELAETLGVSEVKVQRQPGGLRVAVRRNSDHGVDLLEVLDGCGDVPAATALLGLGMDEKALLLNLGSDAVYNILVAGLDEAGKTSLLRSIALSLALTSKQSQLQLAVIDAGLGPARPTRGLGSLYPLNYLPHMLVPVATMLDDAADLLDFLTGEVAYREKQGLTRPVLALIVDDLDGLVAAGGEAVRRPLSELLQMGGRAGLRLIFSATNPTTPALHPLLRHNLPVRLVGKLRDADEARAVSGIQDSCAEYLRGQGDFLALAQGSVVPFQAAYLDDYDLHLVLQDLIRPRRPALLARPVAAQGSGAGTRDKAAGQNGAQVSPETRPNSADPGQAERRSFRYDAERGRTEWSLPFGEAAAEGVIVETGQGFEAQSELDAEVEVAETGAVGDSAGGIEVWDDFESEVRAGYEAEEGGANDLEDAVYEDLDTDEWLDDDGDDGAGASSARAGRAQRLAGEEESELDSDE